MRKASTSIPFQLAEGQEREGTKEYLHFISIARGSLGELHTQYLLAVCFGYVKQSDLQPVAEKIELLGKSSTTYANHCGPGSNWGRVLGYLS